LGELTRVPIRLAGTWRFLPRKPFRPYLGAGLTYTVVGFEPTAELDRMSLNLDESSGKWAYLPLASVGTIPVHFPSDPLVQLERASVETGDKLGWDAIGGVEWTAAARWRLFVELDWSFAGSDFRILWNGADELGLSVPQGSTPVDSALAAAPFGAVYIEEGGLLDVDSDGAPDRGTYYVSGGSFTMDGLSLRLGARFRLR
jgi:hypothetical protein